MGIKNQKGLGFPTPNSKENKEVLTFLQREVYKLT
jgi:hypothetical protein